MANRPINKVLIANRGEIAVRIIRSCKELGIRTVAVFSEPDRSAFHVRLADEAYPVGPAPSTESYLQIEKILKVARDANVDAIHPGYGFLSENATFARSCDKAGIIFIGPPIGAIAAMGDKTAARTLMQEAGVPMPPGTPDAIEDRAQAKRIADEIGYPVLIKAAAGGGGKGMRIVHSPEDFESAIDASQREAAAAFGDDRVFVEKYIDQPRHIEFQVLADQHGNAVHLFERECSIQRRHQKVVEEAPSVVLDAELRSRMGKAALDAARSVDYVGAGTVEFLVDSDGNFYFMEMNTRLQVEHPVTEWITGLDLVAEQIRIAEGEQLGYTQDDLEIRGHSIECRVYAEDPAANFLPAPGTITAYKEPGGPGVRVDSALDGPAEVPIFYDPMISKLVTWGQTREQAIRKMRRALDEYIIAGVQTTIPFCHFVMGNKHFIDGNISTHFVGDHFDPELMNTEEPEHKWAAIVGAFMRSNNGQAQPLATSSDSPAWRERAREE